jgi:short-subunit dehydrogenase involved in D-alanine esterification of teichoic acids
MRKSPDIDCLFLNAGLQHAHNLSKPETVDLATFNYQTHVNYTSLVALTIAFLPYLMAQKSQTSIIL